VPAVDEVRIAFAGAGFCAGWLACWWYLNAAGLVRTRREYYAARKAEGEDVPGDWDDDD
jgi:hypothetical protein